MEGLHHGYIYPSCKCPEDPFARAPIERFSEDIDLAVDYAMLGFTGRRDPLAPDLSRTKQTVLLAEMLAACQTYIGGVFLDRLRERLVEVLGAEGPWKLAVDEHDPNIVHFFYPVAVKGRQFDIR